MRLNNKGMAISVILYSILVLFIVWVFGILSLLASTKFSFDKFRSDIKEKLENTNFAYTNEDYMLASYKDYGNTKQSIFKTIYPEQFNLITSVNFIVSDYIPDDAINNSLIYAYYDSPYLLFDLNMVNKLNLTNFDTSNVTSMRIMFQYCRSLTNLDITHFDMSNIYGDGIDTMFHECEYLISLDLSNFNIVNITTIGNMFGMCISLTTLNIGNIDFSNVTYSSNLFSNANNLINIL